MLEIELMVDWLRIFRSGWMPWTTTTPILLEMNAANCLASVPADGGLGAGGRGGGSCDDLPAGLLH